MDLFKLTQHENHNMEIFKGEEFIQFGCRDCNEMIINIKFSDLLDPSKEILKELLEYSSTIINNYPKTYNEIRKFIIECSNSHYVLIKIKTHIERSVEKDYQIKSSLFSIIHINDLLFRVTNDKVLYANLTNSMFTEKEIKDFIYKIVKTCVKLMFRPENLVSVERSSFVLGLNNYNPNDLNIYVTFNNRVPEEEKAPTDILVVNSFDELKEIMPSYDDIEEWNIKAKLFSYRCKNDLIDISKINKIDILKRILYALGGYDYEEHNVELFNLLIRNIEKEEELNK